ncbi:MAG: ASCH domain-containing protein [Candidatus Woesearchaeota archaeon]
MDHLAILSKKMKLLSKIISGEKTIESRWYKFRKTPYNNISVGDTVYFKESGDPVTVIANVTKALFFNNLDDEKIRKILKEYGKGICVPVSYSSKLSGKKFCTLVFIDSVQVVKPFNIEKKGFGIMAAWITVDSIKKLQKTI